MADNVAITAGAGTTIATDDVSGAHYQKMKVYDATADATTGIYAGEGAVANALRVVAADRGKTRVSLRAAMSASQTGGTVWDPTSGKKFMLTKIVVSCATAGAVQFFDQTDSGNTVIGPVLTLSPGGGWSESWPQDNPYLSATADNILKYTSGAGFTGSVYVEGWEV